MVKYLKRIKSYHSPSTWKATSLPCFLPSFLQHYRNIIVLPNSMDALSNQTGQINGQHNCQISLVQLFIPNSYVLRSAYLSFSSLNGGNMGVFSCWGIRCVNNCLKHYYKYHPNKKTQFVTFEATNLELATFLDAFTWSIRQFYNEIGRAFYLPCLLYTVTDKTWCSCFRLKIESITNTHFGGF